MRQKEKTEKQWDEFKGESLPAAVNKTISSTPHLLGVMKGLDDDSEVPKAGVPSLYNMISDCESLEYVPNQPQLVAICRTADST